MSASMIEMDFEVKDLLTILKTNRQAHAENAEKARRDYKTAFQRILKDKLRLLEDGEVPSRTIPISEPFDFLTNYDEVIAMLEMTKSKTIRLTTQQFKCYALDEWPEKGQFTNLSTSYASHL